MLISAHNKCYFLLYSYFLFFHSQNECVLYISVSLVQKEEFEDIK
jgi:hypothetical protein